jgi:hypothetical protein
MAELAQNTKMKPRGKPFAKGVSGNSGGRPKRTQEEVDLIAACKEKTPEALEVIQDLMTNSTNDRVRLAAAEYILDRAWGKPTQRQEIEPIQLEVFTTDRRPEEVYQDMMQAGRRLVQ